MSENLTPTPNPGEPLTDEEQAALLEELRALKPDTFPTEDDTAGADA